MSKINVGIVGFGAIAKKVHMPNLMSLKNVKVKSIAELNAKKVTRFAKTQNISGLYEDYDEMYKKSDLDAVFICLPSFLHFHAVRSAIQHGIHVFCEKPMGLSSEDAFELVKMAQEEELVLAVGYNRRLAENYQRASKIVKSLKLGRILQVNAILVMSGPYVGWIPSSDWFFNDRYGVLYDLGSHLVDLTMYVLSDRITEVASIGSNTLQGLNIYDNIAAVFTTEKGTLGTLNSGWKIPQDYSAIEVHATAGSLFANPIDMEIRHGSFNSLERAAHHLRSARKNLRVQHNSEAYLREDKAFIDAVRGNTNPLVSGVDALRVLEVLDAIKGSLETGKRTKVTFHTLH